MIYEKPELLVEVVLGNDYSEVLNFKTIREDCSTDSYSKPDCAAESSTDHFSV